MNAREYLITDEEINDYAFKASAESDKYNNYTKQECREFGASWAREKYEIKLAEKEKEIEQLKDTLTKVREILWTENPAKLIKAMKIIEDAYPILTMNEAIKQKLV